YLISKNISEQLALEIRKYLEYKFEVDNNLTLQQEKEIYNKLSNEIKDKIKLSINLQILNKSRIFKDNFSEKFIRNLSLQFNQIDFVNEEYIYKEGDKNDKLYFIQNGTISIEKNNIQIQELQKSQSFGELEFFGNQDKIFNAKSIGQTQILEISKTNFINIIKNYPEDYQKYCLIKDKIQFQQNIDMFKSKCGSCEKNGHISLYCKQVHYQPNKEYVILK
ncbi:hypothetical protein IMG5_189460, partial [Ichthyophthirius multifiliis]